MTKAWLGSSVISLAAVALPLSAVWAQAAPPGDPIAPLPEAAQPAAPVIENRRWALVALDGQPLPAQDPAKTPHFVLHSDGHRVTGSGGCNELVGTYTLNGQALQMLRGPRRELQVCATDMERERAFLFALATTEQWAMEGARLRLLDRLGAQVALLEARPAP